MILTIDTYYSDSRPSFLWNSPQTVIFCRPRGTAACWGKLPPWRRSRPSGRQALGGSCRQSCSVPRMHPQRKMKTPPLPPPRPLNQQKLSIKRPVDVRRGERREGVYWSSSDAARGLPRTPSHSFGCTASLRRIFGSESSTLHWVLILSRYRTIICRCQTLPTLPGKKKRKPVRNHHSARTNDDTMIINLDETPIPFHFDVDMTYNLQGQKTIWFLRREPSNKGGSIFDKERDQYHPSQF
jgi:hypothetical protein